MLDVVFNEQFLFGQVFLDIPVLGETAAHPSRKRVHKRLLTPTLIRRDRETISQSLKLRVPEKRRLGCFAARDTLNRSEFALLSL